MTNITEQAKATEESDGKLHSCSTPDNCNDQKSNSLGNKRLLKNHGGD